MTAAELGMPSRSRTGTLPARPWPAALPATATGRTALLAVLRRALFLALPIVPPALLLLLWSVAAAEQWLPAQILPAPATVWATLQDLITQGDLGAALTISLHRILTGFAIGSLAGVTLGVGLGVSRTLDEFVSPTIRALAQIPTLGWLALLILLLGLGETLNIVLIAKACFVPVVLNTQAAIRDVPAQYRDIATVLRLRRRTILWRVLLPATLPRVFTGFRQALGQAWIALVMVEMLADSEGIGYLITWGRTLFQLDVVLAGILVIGVIGLLLDRVLAWSERRMQPWSPDHGE
jgi:sulfonate transport system permease protein